MSLRRNGASCPRPAALFTRVSGRRHGAVAATPLGPEVDSHGCRAREDILEKCGIGHSERIGSVTFLAFLTVILVVAVRDWESQRCASSAAWQPVAAAVTAWRYRWSIRSPAAKTKKLHHAQQESMTGGGAHDPGAAADPHGDGLPVGTGKLAATTLCLARDAW
jgi:hypothetical protein